MKNETNNQPTNAGPYIAITVTAYRFNLDNAADALAWDALRAKLRASDRHRWESDQRFHVQEAREIAERIAAASGLTSYIDARHLFDNQANTADDRGALRNTRIFDWFDRIHPNAKIRTGYYIDQGWPELQKARRARLACGYCGQQYDADRIEGEGSTEIARLPSGTFAHVRCMASPHLDRDNVIAGLNLFRPVALRRGHAAKPDAGDLDPLLDLWREAQAPRKAAERDDATNEAGRQLRKVIRHAVQEYAAIRWTAANVGSLSNFIYYNHNGGKIAFGWRSEIDPEIAGPIVDLLKTGAPAPWEVKIRGADNATGPGALGSDLEKAIEAAAVAIEKTHNGGIKK